MICKKGLVSTLINALNFVQHRGEVFANISLHYILQIYLIKMQKEGESVNVQFQAGESKNQFINLPDDREIKKQENQDSVYCGPFQQYFITKVKQTQKGKKINSKYNKIIQQKLQQQLLNGKTAIRKKVQLPLQPKIQMSKQELIHHERAIIQRRKDKIVEELKEVLQEEAELIRKNASLNKSHSNSRIIYLNQANQNKGANPQWKQPILQAIKKNREFKSHLLQKSELVKKQFQEINVANIKKEHQRIQEIRQKNRKQAMKRKMRSESLKNMFVKSQNQCASLVSKVKPTRYQFEVLQNNGERLTRQLEEERNQKLQQLSLVKSKRIWEDIKQHQQSYIWRLKQRREQWMSNYQERTSSLKSSRKLYQSIFVDRILAEEIKQKVQQQEAQQKGLRQLEKVKKYNQYILDHFKPNVVHTSQEKNIQLPNLRHSLSCFERRAKGLQYLSLAKKTAKAPERSNLQTNKKVASLPLIKHISLYKDYLREQPKRSPNTTNFSEFQNMIAEQRGDWTHQAFTLIQKMQSIQDKPLFESVNNKLKLLEAMM